MAAPAVPAEPDEAAEAAPARKPKKKLFILIGILVVLLGGGGAGAWFMTRGGDAHNKEAEAEPPKVPVFLALETFTVNLQEGEQYGPRSARCSWPTPRACRSTTTHRRGRPGDLLQPVDDVSKGIHRLLDIAVKLFDGALDSLDKVEVHGQKTPLAISI